MSDEHITCGDCGQGFVFSDTERAFYEQRSLAVPPKRCKPCRDARKQSRGPSPSGGSGGGSGGRFAGPGGPRGGGDRNSDRGAAPSRRYSGDVNEYRSPMAGPDPWGPPATQSRERFSPPGDRRGPPAGRPGEARPFDRGNDRGPGARPAPAAYGDRGPSRNDAAPRSGPAAYGDRGPSRNAAAPRHDAPRTYGRPAEGGSNEYRSPAFPGERARPAWGDERPARRAPGGDRAHGAPPRKAGPAGPAQPKPRKPRPTFEITCGACGEKSSVPFQPEEGRDIFCQPCYQARRELRPEERTPLRAEQEFDHLSDVSPAHHGDDHEHDDGDSTTEE